MDDIVLRGMAKWPDVPAVYGWLSLDRRGAWLLKGEKISHPAVTAFIGRNFEADECGRWFFQNGPQRVYVSLEYTPFVYRVTAADDGILELEAQTGTRTRNATGAWLDDDGAVLIETDLGVGLVHDRDLNVVLGALTDVDGRQLGNDELESRLRDLHEGRDARVCLRGFAKPLPLRGIHSSDVARTFSFDGAPRDETVTTAGEHPRGNAKTSVPRAS